MLSRRPTHAYDIDQIVECIRQAANTHLRPRFRSLSKDEIWEKWPGETVTAADHACERDLGPALVDCVDGSVVIGEEAAAADPSLLLALAENETVWLLDPLDGTSSYAAGSSGYGVMAALVIRGATTLAVLHQPESQRTFVAERGAGTFEYETSRRLVVPASQSSELRGAAKTRFLPAELSLAVQSNEHRFTRMNAEGTACCTEYPAIVHGERDFMLYWRTLPWDHAPGVLMLTEAGGYAAYIDGAPYTPSSKRHGLLVAGNRDTWHRARIAIGV